MIRLLRRLDPRRRSRYVAALRERRRMLKVRARHRADADLWRRYALHLCGEAGRAAAAEIAESYRYAAVARQRGNVC